MSASQDVERIAAPVLRAAGLELVDVELRGGSLVVTVDREGGVDLDVLASVSRALSAAIDREDVGPGGSYELEVSSPGLERRLRKPEHFMRFVGHRVALKTVPGVDGERRLEGEIVAADEDGIVLASPEMADGARRLRFEDIEKAHTVFDWRADLARTDAPTARRERPRRTRRAGGARATGEAPGAEDGGHEAAETI